MEKRAIGASGLDASVLSFGALTFTGNAGRLTAFGTLDISGAQRMVDICVDAGVNLFDTADIYSDGVSEEILGAVIKPHRDHVLIATKVFGRTGSGEYGMGSSRRHIVEGCEASLRRLGTDRIDLYQLHEYDALTSIDETLRALDDLVQAGKVRQIGCSNFTGWQLMKALGIADRDGRARFASQQIYYSLLGRDAEMELLPLSIDQNVGVLVWGPLASGYLSGKFRSDKAAPENSRIGAVGTMGLIDPDTADTVVDMVCAIAEERGVTPSQVALNWLLRKPAITSVIIGARDEAQLNDNLAAASWALSEEEVARLDAVSAIRIPYPLSHQLTIYAAERNPQGPTYRA
jgi:aryl-alcohol dehydrogenase-like predicted oxidoreductase